MAYSLADIIGDAYGMARTTPEDAGHHVEWDTHRVTVWTDATDFTVSVVADADGDAVIDLWHDGEYTSTYSHATAVHFVLDHLDA